MRQAREHPHRERAEHDPDDETEDELSDDEQKQVRESEARLLDPVDEADRQRDRDGVVAAGLGLERARDAPADVRVPERREHGGRVGRRDDGAEQHRLEPREVEERVRREAGEERGGDDADGAEQRGGDGNGAQPPPGRREPAFVQDRREADDADGSRKLGVVELDPARTVRAEQHPEREERDQRRNADSRGAEGDDDAAGEDRADEEEHRPDFHAPLLPILAVAKAQDAAGEDRRFRTRAGGRRCFFRRRSSGRFALRAAAARRCAAM